MMGTAKVDDDLGRYRMVYDTLSQGEAYELKRLLYHYNTDVKLSVRIDWQQQGDYWFYQVKVDADTDLATIMRKSLVNLPEVYRRRIVKRFTGIQKGRPSLTGFERVKLGLPPAPRERPRLYKPRPKL
jgi:hypothetical protein